MLLFHLPQPVNVYLDDLNELLRVLTYSAKGGSLEAFNDHSDTNGASQIPMEEFTCIFHRFQMKLSAAPRLVSLLKMSLYLGYFWMGKRV